ncbi:hypothetical protein [Clostridium weizhouense]|uniref:Carboxypeptidase regulatory-like domain-containing protein n=1 Tax=Clostridium weizhouense TaxID=2859781 RepID=A0ABS7AKW6_9CLOT|nr:hypothetical protein [Clostridium weizhouense]MBW6409267.1 hypothetical protein [Clostridium weizhouense]
MSIIYNERIKNNEYYNKKENNIKNKKEDYTYNLNVQKEKDYRSKYIDLNLNGICNEKYVDIQMEEVKYINISGILRDKNGNIVKNKKVTLFRCELINYRTEYIPICNMITDEKGVYQTVIEDSYKDAHYFVKVAD